MHDADAFQGAAFLGPSRGAKRDAYRLSLFGQHLAADERPLALLPIQSGTLIVTDRRILEMRVHLEVHGAWNVKEFHGYVIHRAIDRETVRDLVHTVREAIDEVGSRRIEDRLLLTTAHGPEEVLVSRGSEPTLGEEDFAVLREAVLGSHA